jgi:hypothetical protein
MSAVASTIALPPLPCAPIAQDHASGPLKFVPLAPSPPSGDAHVTPSHVAPGAQSESLEQTELQPDPWALHANGEHDSAAV